MTLLIVGLGNPGKKYNQTRHNLGFMAVDNLKSEFKNFSHWQKNKKFLSEISQGEIAGKKVILSKPQTFMNQSGQAVKKIIKNLKLKINHLIVIHDELDLPLGKIKIVKNRGSAGHKGVESIIQELGSKDFSRIRIGIQPPTGKPPKPEVFVLEKLKKEEKEIMKKIFKNLIKNIELIIQKTN